MVYVEIFGWIATVLILAGFGLNSFGKISAQSWTYSILNLIGSVLFIWNTYVHDAFAPMVLNIIWACIAIVSMIKKGLAR